MPYNTFEYDFYSYICNENQVIINTDEDTFLLFASYHFTSLVSNKNGRVKNLIK